MGPCGPSELGSHGCTWLQSTQLRDYLKAFIYLVLAAVGLCRCMRVAVHWLLIIAENGLESVGSVVLWGMGLVVPRHVESSKIRDWTCVPCIGRWFLNHSTTGEVHQLHDFHLWEKDLENPGPGTEARLAVCKADEGLRVRELGGVKEGEFRSSQHGGGGVGGVTNETSDEAGRNQQCWRVSSFQLFHHLVKVWDATEGCCVL